MRRPRSCTTAGTAHKGMLLRVCVAPQLHGPAGVGAPAPQLDGFRDRVQGRWFRRCAASGITYKGMLGRVCVASPLHGRLGRGAFLCDRGGDRGVLKMMTPLLEDVWGNQTSMPLGVLVGEASLGKSRQV